MFFYIFVLVAAYGVIAFAALNTGGGANKLCVDKLHGSVVNIAKRRHYLLEPVLFRKFRRRTGCEFVIYRLILIEGGDIHFVIVPFIAAFFGPSKSLVHKPFPKWLIAVDKFKLAKRWQYKIFLNFFYFPKGGNLFANYIVAHNGYAVVGAAGSVVKIPFSAEVGAPITKKFDILPLYMLKNRISIQ